MTTNRHNFKRLSAFCASFALLAGSVLPMAAQSYTAATLADGTWQPSEKLYKAIATPRNGYFDILHYGVTVSDFISDINSFGLSLTKDAAMPIPLL